MKHKSTQSRPGFDQLCRQDAKSLVMGGRLTLLALVVGGRLLRMRHLPRGKPPSARLPIGLAGSGSRWAATSHGTPVDQPPARAALVVHGLPVVPAVAWRFPIGTIHPLSLSSGSPLHGTASFVPSLSPLPHSETPVDC